jgi:hypothetical protein
VADGWQTCNDWASPATRSNPAAPLTQHPPTPPRRTRSLRGPGRGKSQTTRPPRAPVAAGGAGGRGVEVWLDRRGNGRLVARRSELRKSGTTSVQLRFVPYRKSTLGLRSARRSQRGRCSASNSGGGTSFLHLGQTTVGCPMRASLVVAPVRCLSMNRQ